jgi:phage terminase large subunit-like protein
MTKIICNEINEYLEWYENNKDKVNEERHLLIENIVKPTLERDDVFFDEEMLHKCIAYCEKWYYPLFPYQKFIYAFTFMYKDDIPIFQTFPILMGRGNGKDGFIAPLANFLQTPMYNVLNYNIDIVATSEDQSKDTFLVVYDMLERNWTKFKSKFYKSLENIMNLKTRSRLRYNTSNAKTKDGKKTGMVIFNEYHAYEDDSQISVFTSGLGKIKHPRTFIITTDGNVRGGPLDELLDICKEILKTGENDLGYFPFLCRLDNEDEVDNPEMWIKANPSIEYMPILKDTIMKQYKSMKKRPSQRFEFMTKRMNMPVRDEAQSVTSWENILATNQEVPDLSGFTCVGGIDYSDIRDFCGCGLLFKKDCKRYFIHHSFICHESPHLKLIKFDIPSAMEQGLCEMVNLPTITPEIVVDWFVKMSKKYDIKSIAMDTFRYSLLKQAFEAVGFYARDKEHPDGKIVLIRNGNITHSKVAPQIDDMFANHTIVYGDDMMMRWYTNNTYVKTDEKGNKTYKKIEYQSRKTDGFMALVHAMSLDDELPINQNGKLLDAIAF